MTEDEQVRRLLADARHTEPMPDDVAARLDGVIADLRAERPVPAGVADLAAARRRRRARTLLVAAAAVVVVGLGVDQLRDLDMSGGDDSDSATSAGGGDAAAERRQRDGQRTTADKESAAESAPYGGFAFEGASRVGPGEFGAAALRLRDQAVRLARFVAVDGTAASVAKARCRGRDWGTGRVVPIRYDGSPAVLVYRAPRGDTQVVDLYLCGRDDASRSITLPAP